MECTILQRKAARIIRKHLADDYSIFLFGSWARGDARDASDLDIGILGKEKVPWSTMVRITEDIDNLPTLRTVDVVDLRTKDDAFMHNVLRYARKLA